MSRHRKKNRFTKWDYLKIGVLSTLLTALLVGTCLLLLIGSYIGFFESLKSNRVVDTVLSPDGEYQAITFIRCQMDWGGWGNCTPEASILKSGEVLYKADRGNIFIGTEDESLKDIQWLSERKLLIVYTGYDDDILTLQVRQKDDIQIEYQLVHLE